MRLNKEQRFFTEITLEAFDQQFNIFDKKLIEFLKANEGNWEAIKKEIGLILMDYPIVEEKVKLTARERKKVKDKIERKVDQMTMEEYTLETDFLENEYMSIASNLYEYKEYLLGLGMSFDIVPLSKKRMKEIIFEKIDGKDWKLRCWDNKEQVKKLLNKEINDLLTGKTDVNQISRKLRDTFNTSSYVSKRLARTEAGRVQCAISEECDLNHGIEYQLYIATLDRKTCKVCQADDGKVFEIKAPNKPSLPRHPNDRCVLSGIPDKDWRPKARRNNETSEIVKYQNYKDYYSNKKVK